MPIHRARTTTRFPFDSPPGRAVTAYLLPNNPTGRLAKLGRRLGENTETPGRLPALGGGLMKLDWMQKSRLRLVKAGNFRLTCRCYTVKRAVVAWLLGTIFGTVFGVWASGPAPQELRAKGLTLSTWAERPWDAYAGRVEHARKIRREKR